MKKSLVILALTVGFLLISGPSFSYTAVGHMKCETVNRLVKEQSGDIKNTIVFWFSGYYTGRNFETSRNPLKPDPELVYMATVNYCSKNPLQDTVDLADYLYSSLM
mgnify:CR=1 FL=1